MTAHPSDRELADFVSDWLDEQSDSTLRQHLADCGTCRELVEKLRRGDTHKKMEPTAFASPEPPVGSVAADDSLAARLLANPPLPAAIPSRVVFPRGPTEEAPCGGIDHYDLVAALGQGTFGEVYLARDTRLGRQVAIKVLRPRFGRNAEFRRLLANEARLIAGVRGDHTVAVYDVHCGDDAGLSYIALEYVAGGSLNAYLAARRETRGASQPSVREIVELLRQGTLGVQSIHQRGYVHHDLKPSNLLVTTEIDGTGVPRVTRVKVADFGLVRSTTGDGRDGAGDVTAGTEIFMSPQRLAGEGGSDTRDDLYSLGVILFQLLTGRIPRMSDQSAE
ncbi:MAG: serine/threonine-protein kinase, partial [Planctomycetota bacterium]|nr:serine/threonine-protein kinase [Planctomycetota bacterium]